VSHGIRMNSIRHIQTTDQVIIIIQKAPRFVQNLVKLCTTRAYWTTDNLYYQTTIRAINNKIDHYKTLDHC